MHTFFTKTFTPFMIFAALFTAGAGLLAVSPEHITELFLVPFKPEYQLLIQHWGLTTFVIAVLLLASIWQRTWRTPIILLAAVEKLYMVVLFTTLPSQYVIGYQTVAIVDTVIAFYFFLYLYSSIKKSI